MGGAETGKLTLTAFSLLLFGITLGSAGQICFKIGLGHGQPIQIDTSPIVTFLSIIKVMIKPWVLAGLCLYVISTFAYLLALSRVRLSIAYPLISMSYVIVVILSSLILKEPVDWKYAVAGLVCICLGVSLIGFGMGQSPGKP